MLEFKITNAFFDRQKVKDALSDSDRARLSKAGAFVRRRAQTSMRRRKGVAKPGGPPSVHQGDLRQRLFFAYDERSRSVVVGPAKYRAGEVPGLLEFGGNARRSGKSVNYKKFPYMQPALEKEQPNFPDLWKNSITG